LVRISRARPVERHSVRFDLDHQGNQRKRERRAGIQLRID